MPVPEVGSKLRGGVMKRPSHQIDDRVDGLRHSFSDFHVVEGGGLPPLHVQNAFDRLHAEVAGLKAEYSAICQFNAAQLPATLERVFAQGN
jgi:hypothetical protein